MFSSLKKEWRELWKGRPGHRFQDRYKRYQRKSVDDQPWPRRFLQPAAAILLLLAGVILCFIPGPGLPLVLAGAALLANRSRTVARAMDWTESKLWKVVLPALAWWRHASIPARNAVMVLGAVVIAGAGYGAYHVLLR